MFSRLPARLGPLVDPPTNLGGGGGALAVVIMLWVVGGAVVKDSNGCGGVLYIAPTTRRSTRQSPGLTGRLHLEAEPFARL